jgi:hemerythrin-like metal-binding protein
MMTMKLMQWNDDMVTGITEVDRQHRDLLELVNEVAPVLASLGDQEARDVGHLYDKLMAYADNHFKTEEALMSRYEIDSRSLDRHRKAHMELVGKVTGMANRYADGEFMAGEDLLCFLAGWLVAHMLGEDQSMARQIQAIDRGLSPERAFREAGGYRSSPSEEALTRLLINLYAQIIHRE